MKIQEELMIGCIGCGNMGGAIINGLSSSCSVMAYDIDSDKLNAMPSSVKKADDAMDLAYECDIIIIALKPYLVEKTLKSICDALNSHKIIISVAAGISLAKLCHATESSCPVVRCMPNTPALVGAGIFAFCFDDKKLKQEQKDIILELFNKIGSSLELEEKYFIAFGALIGAGPAYVFHILNAFIQAGVSMGFSRDKSKEMILELVNGSLLMAKQSPKSLMELRDDVCSPAGITIEAINHMERQAINGHIVDAILKADLKGKEMEQ